MRDPKFFLQHAARGWLYSIAIEQDFIEPALPPRRVAKHKSEPATPATTNLEDRSARQLLSDLHEIADLNRRWEALNALVNSQQRVVLEDSFAGTVSEGLPDKLLDGQLADGLNIVILGGGCVGLALANALKWSFRNKIDVLVIENRIRTRHFKLPYSRHWLTHLQEAVFEGVYDPQVTHLLSEFGIRGFVGTTVATLETLLLISNKKLGVRFLFDDAYDLSFIAKSNTHLIFDATGGRFVPPAAGLCAGTATQGPATLRTVIPACKQFGRGHHRHAITNWNDVDEQRVGLTPRDGKYRPLWNGEPLQIAMCKLTRVPISLYRRLFEFASSRNADGLLYIWPGNLKPELNKILVLINLDRNGYEHLAARVTEEMSLAAVIQSGAIRPPLDERILMLLRLLEDSGTDLNQIGIEPPFLYSPYVRLMSGTLDRLWNRPIVPVGDSIMNGHPKVGNGLLIHLSTVARMHDIAVLYYGATEQRDQ